MSKQAIRIAVVGPHNCSAEDARVGFEVGAEIARQKAILLCGGLGGMMSAAAEGAQSRQGLTIGILPGEDAGEANPFIDIPLPTGLGAARNMALVHAADAVIAVRGEYGTLSEIAFALRLGVPVVGLRTWQLVKDGQVDAGIRVAATPSEAVELALRLARRP